MAPKLDYMKDRLIDMYQSGMSVYAIAKEVRQYQQAVAVTLDKYIEREKRKDYEFNRNYFAVLNSEDKAYFLGFIAADGSLVDNGNGVLVLSISLEEGDRCILESFKEHLEAEQPIYPVGINQVRMTVTNKKFAADLMKLGIEQRKSLTMEAMLHAVPEQYRKDFIRGYFDGDGSIFLSQTGGGEPRHYVGIRGTEAFLEDFRRYCGIRGSLRKDGGIHQWRFGAKEDVIKFRNLIYQDANVYLARKHDKFPW